MDQVSLVDPQPISIHWMNGGRLAYLLCPQCSVRFPAELDSRVVAISFDDASMGGIKCGLPGQIYAFAEISDVHYTLTCELVPHRLGKRFIYAPAVADRRFSSAQRRLRAIEPDLHRPL